jgi:hypothetical protein
MYEMVVTLSQQEEENWYYHLSSGTGKFTGGTEIGINWTL